jgi:hypothetical protein
MFSAFNDIPEGRYLLDSFAEVVLDPDVWDAAVVSGDTSIVQPGVAGKVGIRNLGTGVLGTSHIPSAFRLGKHNRISIDIELAVGSAGADGNHADAALVLWADANNFIKAGPYRDTTAVLNDRVMMSGKVAGVAFGPTALAGAVTDTVRHTITFAVVESRVLIFSDGLKVGSHKMPGLFDYRCWAIASTTANADKVTAWFYDFEILNQFDALPLTLGTNVQSIINTLTPFAANDPVVAAAVAGNMAINDAIAHILEFTTATFGSRFSLSLAMDISGARIDYCRLDDGGAFSNQDLVAKGLSVGDVRIVPAAGAQVNDAIYFGLSGDSHRLDVVMLGGTYNTDNTFVWEYWNGGAWAALTVTDGTIASVLSFGQNGSVIWTEHLGSTAVNGVTAYWVRARVSAAGVSLPVGSHMQFSPHDAVDFDSLAVMGGYLKVEIYRKVGAAYTVMPSDVWEYMQSNISKIIEVSLECYSDTKVVLTSEVAPTASVTIPYKYAVTKVRT